MSMLQRSFWESVDLALFVSTSFDQRLVLQLVPRYNAPITRGFFALTVKDAWLLAANRTISLYELKKGNALLPHLAPWQRHTIHLVACSGRLAPPCYAFGCSALSNIRVARRSRQGGNGLNSPSPAAYQRSNCRLEHPNDLRQRTGKRGAVGK